MHIVHIVRALEFDPGKDAANLAKHGVSLSAGDGVLLDPLAVTVEDDAAEGEKRWVTVGSSILGRIMVVAWTNRNGVARMISVRRATPRERRAYEG